MGAYIFTKPPLNPVPVGQRGAQPPSRTPPSPRTQPRPIVPKPAGIGGTIPVRNQNPKTIEQLIYETCFEPFLENRLEQELQEFDARLGINLFCQVCGKYCSHSVKYIRQEFRDHIDCSCGWAGELVLDQDPNPRWLLRKR